MIGALTGFVAFFLSSTFFQYFRIFGVIFNAGVVMTTLFALCSDKKNTLASAAVYGSLVDLYASRLLGINLLIYLVIAISMLHLAATLYKESVTLPYLLFFLSTAVYHIIYIFIMILFRIQLSPSELAGVFFLESIYNILIGIGIYYLIMKTAKGRRND